MDPPASPGRRAIQAYYLLATPAFAVLDFVAGVNVRAAFLDGPLARLLYYAFAFACGLAATRWPARAPLVGLLESGVNIACLILGVGIRYLEVVDAAASEAASVGPLFEGGDVVNLVVSAAILIVSYLVATARLGRPAAGDDRTGDMG